VDTKHIGLQLYAFKLELLLFFFWFFSFSGLLRVDVLQQTSRTKSERQNSARMHFCVLCVLHRFSVVYQSPLGKDHNDNQPSATVPGSACIKSRGDAIADGFGQRARGWPSSPVGAAG